MTKNTEIDGINYSILRQKNFNIGNFILPPQLRKKKVGIFILNRIQELMPDEVGPFTLVKGDLIHKVFSIARNAFCKKLINLGNNSGSMFVESIPEKKGCFSGGISDVKTGWHNNLLVIL